MTNTTKVSRTLSVDELKAKIKAALTKHLKTHCQLSFVPGETTFKKGDFKPIYLSGSRRKIQHKATISTKEYIIYRDNLKIEIPYIIQINNLIAKLQPLQEKVKIVNLLESAIQDSKYNQSLQKTLKTLDNTAKNLDNEKVLNARDTLLNKIQALPQCLVSNKDSQIKQDYLNKLNNLSTELSACFKGENALDHTLDKQCDNAKQIIQTIIKTRNGISWTRFKYSSEYYLAKMIMIANILAPTENSERLINIKNYPEAFLQPLFPQKKEPIKKNLTQPQNSELFFLQLYRQSLDYVFDRIQPNHYEKIYHRSITEKLLLGDKKFLENSTLRLTDSLKNGVFSSYDEVEQRHVSHPSTPRDCHLTLDRIKNINTMWYNILHQKEKTIKLSDVLQEVKNAISQNDKLSTRHKKDHASKLQLRDAGFSRLGAFFKQTPTQSQAGIMLRKLEKALCIYLKTEIKKSELQDILNQYNNGKGKMRQEKGNAKTMQIIQNILESADVQNLKKNEGIPANELKQITNLVQRSPLSSTQLSNRLLHELFMPTKDVPQVKPRTSKKVCPKTSSDPSSNDNNGGVNMSQP
jgi:hypothetical protein